MIGMLTGNVVFRLDSSIILDVAGVGYKVLVPQPVLRSIDNSDKSLRLFIHTHVREDLLELYGFTEPEDLRIFEQLISVSGVGCKTALGVFTVGSRSDIVKAIIAGDALFFTAVPRLGKKNAQKIIIDLKNKMGSGGGDMILDVSQEGLDEVVEALKSFGFSTAEAISAVRMINQEGLSTSDKIRLALKQLGR